MLHVPDWAMLADRYSFCNPPKQLPHPRRQLDIAPSLLFACTGVFDAMASAAGQVTVLDWGVANATLEEVFIKFAKSIGAEGGN